MAATVPSELPVFTRYYDLFVWSFQRSEGFPKVLRLTLAQRFGELLLTALELLLELRYTRERQPLFARVNLTLEKLRVLSRALKDRRAHERQRQPRLSPCQLGPRWAGAGAHGCPPRPLGPTRPGSGSASLEPDESLWRAGGPVGRLCSNRRRRAALVCAACGPPRLKKA